MNFNLKNEVITSIVIKKSEFICYLKPVYSIEEVNTYLSEIRLLNATATHNVYAYVLNGQSIQKCSDDGEPNRTAGYPILNMLLTNNLDNCICIVSRYFGGIKLGGGGLIRAYAQSTNESIKLSELIEQVIYHNYELTFDYHEVSLLENYCLKHHISINEKIFVDKVYFTISCDETQFEQLREYFINITKNMGLLQQLD